MSKMAEYRAKLLAKQGGNKDNNRQRSSGDNASYQFWNMNFGDTAIVRFLNDGDQSNDDFWTERQTCVLPFSGVVGGDYPTNEDVKVTVPCIDMFNIKGKRCPIITGTKSLWDTNEELAKVYWKKRSYIFQGFVVESPFAEENVPENPIRRIVANPMVFKQIFNGMIAPDMEDMPIDYDLGCDFMIRKTQNGKWAEYTSSNFARRSRSLNEAERSAIDKFGLFNLKDALGAIPSDDAIDALGAMLQDSLDGKPYDMASFGEYFRPYGNRGNGNGGGNSGGNTGGNTGGNDRAAPPSRTDSDDQAAAATTIASSDVGANSAMAVLDRLRHNNNAG